MFILLISLIMELENPEGFLMNQIPPWLNPTPTHNTNGLYGDIKSVLTLSSVKFHLLSGQTEVSRNEGFNKRVAKILLENYVISNGKPKEN